MNDLQVALAAWRALVVENQRLKEQLHELTNRCKLLEQQKGESVEKAQQVQTQRRYP